MKYYGKISDPKDLVTLEKTQNLINQSTSGTEDASNKVTEWSSPTTDAHYPSEKLVKTALDGKAPSSHTHTKSQITDFPTFATVATSGSYGDLSNKPTIPTKVSELTNDSGYTTNTGTVTTTGTMTSSHVVVSNGGTVIKDSGYTIAKSVPSDAKFTDTVTTATVTGSGNAVTSVTASNGALTVTKGSTFLTSHQDISGKEDKSNKVASWSTTTTDTHYPSEKLVKSALDGKADLSHTHTKSQITDFPTLATVATSGSYGDLSNKPTIPTVNNATLTIQKNGTNVGTFSANASTNVTANITVPTNVSDLTNDSGYQTYDGVYEIAAAIAGDRYTDAEKQKLAGITAGATTYTFAGGNGGFTVTPSGGSAQTVSIKSIIQVLTEDPTSPVVGEMWITP